MAFFRSQTIFHRDTANPADDQSNTMYWETDGGGSEPVEAALIVTELTDFYGAIDQLMPAAFFTNTADVKIYNMSHEEPRFPVLEDTIALTLGTGTPTLPTEITCVMSFHGEFESGVNRARRRGRVFLPTFISAVENSGNMEWGATTTTAVTTAGAALINNGVAGLNWAVFSPTTLGETGSLDQAFNDVVEGWVDTDPDVQRRRGPEQARTRVTFS